MFLPRKASHCQPMLVSYYDESIDQDVLRVVKQIRQRSGVTPKYETKKSNVPSSRKNNRKKEQQQHQSLPKYNVEIQTDSCVSNNNTPIIPSISVARKFPHEGHQDEFDYVDYQYNDTNEVRPVKPTMLKVRTHSSNLKEFKSARPPTLMIPPTVDTNIASLVKPYDSPTRHIKEIESCTMTTRSDSFWTGLDSTDDDDDDHDDDDSMDDIYEEEMVTTSFQPYSFVCSAVSKQTIKNNTNQQPTHKILTSFTDNETLDLSVHDDYKKSKTNSKLDTFWGRIVNGIVGVIVPERYDDDDIDETVLLTARAKYDDFFDSVASPASLMPESPISNIDSHKRYDPVRVTRSQLPPKIRSNLLDDFLNQMLGRDKDDEDCTIAGKSYNSNRQSRKTVPLQQLDTNRVKLHTSEVKFVNQQAKRPIAEVKLRKTSESVVYHKPNQATKFEPVPSNRSRSRLHDMVDNLMERVASKNRTTSGRCFASRSNQPIAELVTKDEDDNLTNFFTEISIPNTRTGKVVVSTDDYSISSTVMSTYSNNEAKRTVSRTMAIWDNATTNERDDDDSYDSDDDDSNSESSIFSSTFDATSFTFD